MGRSDTKKDDAQIQKEMDGEKKKSNTLWWVIGGGGALLAVIALGTWLFKKRQEKDSTTKSEQTK